MIENKNENNDHESSFGLASPASSYSVDESSFRSRLQNKWELDLSSSTDSLVPYRRMFLPSSTSFYESQDYDVVDSEICRKDVLEPQKFLRKTEFSRWLLVVLIGVMTGATAFLVNYTVRAISYYKFSLITYVTDSCSNCFWIPFSVNLLINLSLVLFATIAVTLFEPAALGSGIPEIKCYLNGIKIPRILRLKTLFAKLFGVISAVAGGLVIGQESTMIHCGAIIAAGISQGKSLTIPGFDTKLWRQFRNDREKRDFICAGAAAGFGAGFGAPIGGILFTLEEASSFWNQKLTWRTFFASIFSAFTVNILLSGTYNGAWGMLSQPGLVSFGSFFDQNDHTWVVTQLPIFILLGIVGGLFGALFNWLNLKLILFRKKHITSTASKIMEVVLVSVVTSVVTYVLSFFVHSCRRLDSKRTDWNLFIDYFQFDCPTGYYNDMATILYATQETSLRQLLHKTGEGFSVSMLCLFFIIFFFLALWTCGVSVPAGLFVPNLVVGAAYGRIVGQLVSAWFPDTIPGSYALIGAASMLGGVTRMTLSLTVVLVETTNDITYGLPIVIVLIITKWVGDRFTKGIFDIQIEAEKIAFLKWDAPYFMRKLTARDVMTRKVYTFREIESVGKIYQVLTETTHNGFPVVNEQQQFLGLIRRNQLITLLRRRAFTADGSVGQVLPPSVFEEDYPRFPGIDTVVLQPGDTKCYMNLTPYYDQSPYVVLRKTPLQRVYRLFRSMGLRHLVVVNKHNNVRGIITRKDLTYITERLTIRKDDENEPQNGRTNNDHISEDKNIIQ
jgi:chloride channel 7